MEQKGSSRPYFILFILSVALPLLAACGGGYDDGGTSTTTTVTANNATTVSGRVVLSGTVGGKPSAKVSSAPSVLVQAVVEMYDADRPEWQHPVSYALTDMNGDYKLSETAYAAENGGSYADGVLIPAGNYTVVAHKYDPGTGKLWVAVQPYVKKFLGDALGNDLIAQEAGVDPQVDSMFGLRSNGDNTFGGTGISLSRNAAVQMTFNTAMARLTVLNAVKVSDQGGTPVPGRLKISPDLRTVAFYPDSPLAVGTIYTVVVAGGADPTAAKNLYERPLPATVIGTFKCTNADSTPPNAIKISPNSQTGVATNTPIRVASNEELDIHTFDVVSSPSIGVKPDILYVGRRTSFDEYKFVYEIKPATELLPGTDYSITVSGTTDIAGNPLTPLTFNFKTGTGSDTTAPGVSSTTPLHQETNVSLRPTITATFDEPIDVTTITPASFMLYTGTSYALGYVFGNESTASFVPTTDLLPGVTYTATLTTAVKDPAGNPLSADHSWTFTTAATPDTTPPWVTGATPAGGAFNVPINVQIKAVFSEAVDPMTIGFTVSGISGNVTYDNMTNTAVFTPSAPLTYYTSYTATIAAGVRDLSSNGNVMASPYSWSFLTTVPPEVVKTDPPDKAKNVDINKVIKATFSTPMDATTITASTFLVNGATASSVAYDAPTRTAVFTPSLQYAYNTIYTATITTGVKDQDGNPLPADYSWIFTTKPVPPPPTYDEKVNGFATPMYDYAQLVYNTAGNGLAVWIENSGISGGYRLMYSMYNKTADAWSPEDVVDTISGVNVDAIFSVATNGAGFIVVWGRNANLDSKLYARIHDGSSWGQTTVLDGGNGKSPSAASDGSGYAVTWMHYTGVSTADAHAIVYDPVTGWGTPAVLDVLGTLPYYPQAASNGSGYAVTWIQQYGSEYNVYAVLQSGGIWSDPVSLESSTVNVSITDARPRRIASNGTGYAVIWAYTGGTAWASISDGSAWGAPQQIDPDYGNTLYIGSNGTGYAVAWTQTVMTTSSIYANVASSVTGTTAAWGGRTYVNTPPAYGASPCSLTSNGAGYALAFLAYNTTFYDLYVNVHNGANWSSTSELIDTGNTPVALYSAGLAWDGMGYTAIWAQPDAQNRSNIHVRRYTTGWGTNSTLVNLHAYSASPEYLNVLPTPKVVMNSAGVALAVWTQYDNGKLHVFGNRYSNNSWGAPFRISTDPISPAGGDIIQVETDGTDFIVVWITSQGQLFMRTCSSTGSLSIATQVSTSGNYVTGGQFALATNGNGYALVWIESGALYAGIYDGNSWTTSALFTGTQIYSPRLSSSGIGYAVVWRQNEGGVNNLYADVYDGSAWLGVQSIENSTNNLQHHAISSNGTGYAVAWVDINGSNYDVYANVYDGMAWGSEVRLSSTTSSYIAYDVLRIASNGSGYAAAWCQRDGSIDNIYANIFSGSSWSGAVLVDGSATTYSYEPKLASNGTGYAVTWIDYVGGKTNLFANMSANGTTWGGPIALDTSTIYNVLNYSTGIASNGSGYAVVWTQRVGSTYPNVYANNYDGSAWSAPRLIESRDGDVTSTPRISTNGAGYAAAWLQVSATDPIVYDVIVTLGL